MSKQCKHNPKKFWNYIDSRFNSKQQIADVKVQDAKGQTTITYLAARQLCIRNPSHQEPFLSGTLFLTSSRQLVQYLHLEAS